MPFVKDKDATIRPPAADAAPAEVPAAEPPPALETPPTATNETPAPAEPARRRGLLSRIPGLGGDN